MKMDITYFGHSSFRLRGKSATLVTDPYNPSTVGLKYPKITADIVTVSHDHDDHNDVSAVREVKRVISGPGEYEISGISVIGMSTFHDDKKGEERGRNVIYVIEIDDIRAVHLGDLGHDLTEEQLEELGTVDVLMVPIGGVYTIDASAAAKLVRAIEPSITIPMHYKLKGMNEGIFGKLGGLEEFLKEVSLSVENTDKLVIKKGEIVEEKKVVVLEKRE